MPDLYIGTSAFTAAGWQGSFYPAGMKPADFLTYYATKFDSVEVDCYVPFVDRQFPGLERLPAGVQVVFIWVVFNRGASRWTGDGRCGACAPTCSGRICLQSPHLNRDKLKQAGLPPCPL